MNWVPLVIIIAVAAIAWAGWWLVRAMRSRPDSYHVVRCPKCKQKVRYLASKAGRPSVCPRCRKPITLPDPSGVSNVSG